MKDCIQVINNTTLSQEMLNEIIEEEIMLFMKTNNKNTIKTILIELNETEDGSDELEAKISIKPIIKRLARITGYLSNVENFNDGKKSELKDRVPHKSDTEGWVVL